MSGFLWFIGFLLILWLALTIAGFVVKGLLWLAVVGFILFVITGIIGYFVGMRN